MFQGVEGSISRLYRGWNQTRLARFSRLCQTSNYLSELKYEKWKRRRRSDSLLLQTSWNEHRHHQTGWGRTRPHDRTAPSAKSSLLFDTHSRKHKVQSHTQPTHLLFSSSRWIFTWSNAAAAAAFAIMLCCEGLISPCGFQIDQQVSRNKEVNPHGSETQRQNVKQEGVVGSGWIGQMGATEEVREELTRRRGEGNRAEQKMSATTSEVLSGALGQERDYG